MKRSVVIAGAAVALLVMAVSCEFISSIVQDGKVVAKAGAHKLYSTELSTYIPEGVSAEDSTKLALQYINSWATEMLFQEVAEKELSKQDLDVSRELEDYRRSLIKYRYEQNYVNQRLDTAISYTQIEDYYNSHIGTFSLEVPIVKARFMSFSPDSPHLPMIRKSMASKDMSNLFMADSIASVSALRYTNFKDTWVNAIILAREFETDYVSMFAKMKNGYIEMEDSSGNINIAYVSEILGAGEKGPIEYYSSRIRDIILSTRKQKLLSGLERDLIDKALDNGNFVIF